MSLQSFKQSQLFSRRSPNLTKLGFDFSADVTTEFTKIQSLLYSLYHIRCESMLTIMKMFDIPSSKTMDTLFKLFDIESRSFSEALANGVEQNRVILPQDASKYPYKQGWHTTWDGKQIYYRSSYELDYARSLDGNKIVYDTECMRLKYFDTQKSKYRIAVPDFYIPSQHKLVEIKSTYWYDAINMSDKSKEYRKLGFDFLLILDGAPTEI